MRGPLEVLLILPKEDYRLFTEAPWKWRFHFTRNFKQAVAVLEQESVEIILTDYRIDEDHSWRDLFQERPSRSAPVVIVADRNADETMWVEVLTHGAFDLLRMPFSLFDVDRALNEACKFVRHKSVPQPAASQNCLKTDAAA